MTKNTFLSLAHRGAQTLSPYQPGGFINEVPGQKSDNDIIKLASNENPLGCSSEVYKSIQGVSNSLSSYPDADGALLKAAIADKYDIDKSMITLGAGSESIIQMLITVFNREGAEILFPQYSFVSYKLQSIALQADYVEIPSPNYSCDVDAVLEHASEKTALLFLANPNNPTGAYLNKSELYRLISGLPETTIIALDEAYYEFAKEVEDYPDSLDLQQQFPNIVILRTFSKAYGLAGLRIGYCISHPDIADLINRVRLAFNTTLIAHTAAATAMDDNAFLQRTIINNQQGLMSLIIALKELNLPFIPSIANFITVDLQEDSSSLDQFMKERKIILRTLKPYGLPNHIRISIGSENEMSRVIAALKEYKGEES